MADARLFFEKPNDDADRQRLLLLTHHFPPGDAVGALRWRRFAGIFAAHGWSLDVVTLTPGSTDSRDDGALAELPPGTRVFGIEPPDPPALRAERWLYRAYERARSVRHAISPPGGGRPDATNSRGSAGAAPGSAVPSRPEALPRATARWNLGTLRGWARLWFTFRDAGSTAAWARQVARAAGTVANPSVHRAIITSGPPHAWHEAGRRLSSETGLPLVIDLRDPWAVADVVHEYFATPASLALTARRERRVVRQAALVVANTQTLRDAMALRHPAAADRMITVMNGFDDEPAPGTPAHGPAATFTIGYAGSIYFGRDPRPLFEAVARVVGELGVTPAELQVRFIGQVERYGGVPLVEIATQAGVADFVQVGERVDREAARHFMARCHVLVSLPWDDDLTIPAKLFEYLRFDAWLLVFARERSAIAGLLRGRDADLVGNDDALGAAEAIRRRFLQHRAGVLPTALSADPGLSREAQARILLGALDGVVRRAPATAAAGGKHARTRAATPATR
jgi:hypothetical protein